MFPEIVVAPRESNYCEYGTYYIFYILKKVREGGNKNDNNLYSYSLNYHIVDPERNTISSPTSYTLLGEAWDSELAAGLTITNFISGTNNRRLYYVYFDRTNNMNYIKFLTLTPTGVSGPYSVASFAASTKVLEPNEVEISEDMSKLVFVRPKTMQPNSTDYTNDLTIVHLNPSTGYINTALGTNGYTYVDIGLTNSFSDKYVGVEFSEDNEKIFVTRSGTGVYSYNISSGISTQILGTSYIANSQLELARDGYVYGIGENGQTYTIANDGTFTTGAYNVGTSGVITNSYYGSGVSSRTLPEQIDRFAYDDLFGPRPSEVITTMPGVSHNSTTGDITITGSNVSWTQTSNPFTSGGQAITDIYLKGDLKIDQGARLNIFGLTLHFKENEALVMDYSTSPTVTGPKLYLYSSSKLTVFDDCDENSLWKGIDCNGWWGNGYAQSGVSVLLQPFVYVSSSTIEFAEKGIDVSCGGIVKAINSYFKDNVCDVSFTSWDLDNISYFTNCDFYTTSELYNKGYSPTQHVHLWTASGLDFSGCEFRNDYANSVSISQRGIGILSTASSITVKEKCSLNPQLGYPCPDQNTTRGIFTDLYYGIKASSGSFYTLSRQDFNNCVKGAWLIASDAITVTECNFDVSPETLSGSLLYDSFGLYVESSTGYHIEDNEFHDGVLGMVVLNSGEDENLIYRNDFENLSGNSQATGFVGIGINYDYDTKYGLQLWCNDFIDVDYAMTVLGGDVITSAGAIVNVPQSDIRSTQGMEFYGYTHKSTYNYFEGIPLNEDRYFVVDPNVSQVPYYYYNQTNTAGYRLEEYASNVIVSNRAAETCPQTIYSYGGIIIPLMETIGGFNDEEIELESQVAELTSYNELELEISAQTANDNNISSVHNSLNEASPNLTSEILLAYLNNTNVSELSRTSLMLANSPLPKDVVEAVRNSDLSATYKAYILKSQNGENEIEQKINRISSLKSARQVNYDKLVRATFIADTTPEFAQSYEMVLGFLETQTDLHAKKKLADLYLHKGLYDNALAVLDDIENIALSNDDISLLNDVKITEVKIDMLRTHSMEDAQNAIRNNEEFLRELAADYNTKEGGAARAMLESAGLWDNFPIVFLPNPEQTMEDRSARVNNYEDSQELIPELESLFSIYPNPADNYLSIEFINPEGNCTFSIFTIKGDLVKTVSTNQQLGFMSIDISNLEAGNYIINCKELNSSQSFMIVR